MAMLSKGATNLLTAELRFLNIRQNAAQDDVEAGQVAEEIQQQNAFNRALLLALYAFYLAALGDPASIPNTTSVAALTTYFNKQIRGNALARQELARVLGEGAYKAFNVGGQLALDMMGLETAVFTLTDEDMIGSIERWADSNANPYTRLPQATVAKTTASDLARQVSKGILLGLAASELLSYVDEWIIYRSVQRAQDISQTESTRWEARAMVATYDRNDIDHVRYVTRPELTATGVCTICEPYDGQEFQIISGVLLAPDLPQHPNCVCVYVPVIDGWDMPDQVWAGGDFVMVSVFHVPGGG